MPDENRFAGLGDQLDPAESDDESDDESVDDTATASAAATGDTAPASDAAADADAEQSAADSDERSEASDGGPAFAFDDTRAKSLYVRPETVELLEDAEFEVEAILRREHGIRDLTGREFHDALVRAVAADPEAVAEFVVDAREE